MINWKLLSLEKQATYRLMTNDVFLPHNLVPDLFDIIHEYYYNYLTRLDNYTLSDVKQWQKCCKTNVNPFAFLAME